MSQVSVDEVVTLLIDALNLAEDTDAPDIQAGTQLFGNDDLGLDSLDALQLAVAIEERFGVKIDEGDGQRVFANPQALADHVNANR